MTLHILEEADVLRVDGEIAWIDPERRSTCSGCSAKNGCGTGTLAGVLGKRRVEMRAINHIGAKPGDRVVVGVAGAALLRGSVAVYVVPPSTVFRAGSLWPAYGRQAPGLEPGALDHPLCLLRAIARLSLGSTLQ